MEGIIKNHPWSLHVLLLLIVISYAAIGGLVFTWFESRVNLDILGEKLEILKGCIDAVLANGMANATNVITEHCFGSVLAEQLQPWTYEMSTLYSFTVMTTVGYGRMTPRTEPGRIFCICFAVVGIPLTMIVIANFGKFLASFACESFHKLKEKCFARSKPSDEENNNEKSDENDEDSSEYEVHQPTGLMVLIGFFAYVLMGGILMQLIEDDLSFVNGIFYIFMWITAIDVASIGSGSLIFLPLKLLYAVIGLALATIAIEVGSNFLQKIHWFGRKPKNLENVKIWFGGEQVTVKHLTRSIGRKFGVDPDVLDGVLDMAKVVEVAIAEEQGEVIPEEEEPLFHMFVDKNFTGSFNPALDGIVNIDCPDTGRSERPRMGSIPKVPYSANLIREYLDMPTPKEPVWRQYASAKEPLTHDSTYIELESVDNDSPNPKDPSPPPEKSPTPSPPRTPTPEVIVQASTPPESDTEELTCTLDSNVLEASADDSPKSNESEKLLIELEEMPEIPEEPVETVIVVETEPEPEQTENPEPVSSPERTPRVITPPENPGNPEDLPADIQEHPENPGSPENPGIPENHPGHVTDTPSCFPSPEFSIGSPPGAEEGYLSPQSPQPTPERPLCEPAPELSRSTPGPSDSRPSTADSRRSTSSLSSLSSNKRKASFTKMNPDERMDYWQKEWAKTGVGRLSRMPSRKVSRTRPSQ